MSSRIECGFAEDERLSAAVRRIKPSVVNVADQRALADRLGASRSLSALPSET